MSRPTKHHICRSCGWVNETPIKTEAHRVDKVGCRNCRVLLSAEPRNVAIIIDKDHERNPTKWGFGKKARRKSRALYGDVRTFADGTAWG